jgi:hypothetical protein
LRQIEVAMRSALGSPCKHLRVNIALETTRKHLRIAYAVNMEQDADDRLEFDREGGACGTCWKSHDFVIADLAEARARFTELYRMTKYQQALVRPSLLSLLCVPIFNPKTYDKNRPDIENPLIGVLSFDSDDLLLAEFSSESVRTRAADASRLLANVLRP